MGISSKLLGSLSILVLVFTVAHGDPPVPAVIIFGDSLVDVGNNYNLTTLVKANFPPYGRVFITHRPTGRFSNGKLATDFTADYLGFTSYPPSYLSQEAKGVNTLTGVNFASAASGYCDNTARLYGTISLTQQLNNYREYQNEVVSMVGRAKANAIFSGAIHLLSAGTSDFIQNYYINPLLVFSPDQFSDILMISYSTFIQPVLDMITNPGDNGFFETRRACCGTGRLETSMFCNSRSVTCTNATGYVFWDGFHPSEAANEVLAGNLLQQGFDLIY
ncbi:hypothetical protein Pyn_00070 [Prunus yedoensis var. nudiflora]|uniref:GDSL esterase/lipase n=1 Tax=Prunus yedoensis var. nudiflora TaxID=2094558 RepID=A0A314YRI7_PRUYE|nr:hypothetical protein Pyn_00070 [Prunus yedoensis var. nudiflora]